MRYFFGIPKLFLPQLWKAITLVLVNKLSIFQLILKICNQNQLWIKNKQVDLATLGGVRAKTKKMRRESGVPEMKNWNHLFSIGFRSNMVHFTFLTSEIDIRPILTVLADFRTLKGILRFSAIALHKGKLWSYQATQRHHIWPQVNFRKSLRGLRHHFDH